MSEEKRHYSRVQTNLHAWMRPLPSPQAPPIFNDSSNLLAGSSENLLHESRLPESLMNFLMDMDRKLQAILGMLGRDQLLADFPLQIIVTEISGAGIRFISDTALKIGEPMEVVVALSQIPLRLAGAIGKPTRIEESPSDQQHAYAFEFTRIREAQLDQVIGFVLQEERRAIRERKWE